MTGEVKTVPSMRGGLSGFRRRRRPRRHPLFPRCEVASVVFGGAGGRAAIKEKYEFWSGPFADPEIRKVEHPPIGTDSSIIPIHP